MSEDDFEIIFDKNILSVSGTRIDTIQTPKIFHQMEVVYGDFFTAFEINIPLDLDNSFAKYENGYLVISIDKATPKTIKIGK
jgi:HSP20 family protein